MSRGGGVRRQLTPPVRPPPPCLTAVGLTMRVRRCCLPLRLCSTTALTPLSSTTELIDAARAFSASLPPSPCSSCTCATTSASSSAPSAFSCRPAPHCPSFHMRACRSTRRGVTGYVPLPTARGRACPCAARGASSSSGSAWRLRSPPSSTAAEWTATTRARTTRSGHSAPSSPRQQTALRIPNPFAPSLPSPRPATLLPLPLSSRLHVMRPTACVCPSPGILHPSSRISYCLRCPFARRSRCT